MSYRWLLIAGTLVPAFLPAQTGRGPFARIAILRPHDGRTVDFEAGYIRHLAWHRQAGDPWVWYGWTVWAGERQRWFIYATFGRSAGSLDSAVAPADDERDNVLNVVPHGEFMGNAIYEFLPAPSSRGSGEPPPSARMELTTVDLVPGGANAFEAGLAARKATLHEETLWYRMVAGGTSPRYVRLRPRPNLASVLEKKHDPLVEGVDRVIARMTVEILNLRPTMSLGLP
jgi:hypothetical protein